MKMNKGIQNDEDYMSVLNNKNKKADEIKDGASSYATGFRKQKAQQQKRLDDSDWGLIFDNFLEHDKIDVPEDFYDEDVLFDEPDQLMELFTYLEE